MANKYQQKLHMFNSKVLLLKEGNSGVETSDFELITGSRLVFALSIKSIDPATSIVVSVKNGFTVDFPFEEILSFNGDSVGFFKKVLTDVHNLFDIQVTVSGGNATYALGVSVSDNAFTKRILSTGNTFVVDVDSSTQQLLVAAKNGNQYVISNPSTSRSLWIKPDDNTTNKEGILLEAQQKTTIPTNVEMNIYGIMDSGATVAISTVEFKA